MNYLDLFSGIGGFALGAYWAGLRFDRHYFSEIDPWCCKLYQRRFPDAVSLGDIREIDGRALADSARRESGEPPEWEGREDSRGGSEETSTLVADAGRAEREGRNETSETDSNCGGTRSASGSESASCRGGDWILTGGFPCQDISVAGKGAGIGGVRSGLWFEYARLIGEIRPRYAIMENVGALTRRGLDRVLGSLAEIGYDAEWSDIRASDVGAPHRRERIWIVAYPHGRRLSEPGVRPQFQERTETVSASQNDRDSNRERKDQVKGFRKGKDSNLPGVRRNVRHSISPGLAQRQGEPSDDGTQLAPAVGADWWSVEPDVGRVAHGIPTRVDRLRGLGNAIVPQIAEMIFRGLEL